MTIQETPVRRPLNISTYVYYVNPHNREHINTRKVPVEIATTDTVLVEALLYGIGVIAVATVIYMMLPSLGWVLMITATLIALAIPIRLAAQKNQMINERLKQSGEYILGEILTCVGGTGSGRSGFNVTTTYKFYTPTGMRRTGTSIRVRPDLDGKQLPVPGTPVVVLYFSDTEHYLL